MWRDFFFELRLSFLALSEDQHTGSHAIRGSGGVSPHDTITNNDDFAVASAKD